MGQDIQGMEPNAQGMEPITQYTPTTQHVPKMRLDQEREQGLLGGNDGSTCGGQNGGELMGY